MKLLLFSDVHCDTVAAGRLVEMSQEVDVAVGAGDFATMRRNLKPTLDALKPMKCPIVLVAGNSESDEELAEACRDWEGAVPLHGEQTVIEGVTIFGLGGAVPVTPFGAWSFDLDESEAERLLESCPEKCVLVTHSPPHGAVDADSRGRRLGSAAIRRTIKRAKPALVVCGHIHASAGQTEWLDQTPVVNAGPKGVIWELA